MPNAPEPNVSIYAKLAFHALFDGFEKLNLGSVGTFMFFGVSEVLNESVINGRDILRFKRLSKDVILEANEEFLFTQGVSPILSSLTSILEAEDPPAPKSKAPSCRSEWYQNVLGSFFDVYDQRYSQREPVAKFLANWLKAYLACVSDEPERSVFVSRFKEAFDPINKRYRSPVPFKAAKTAPAQLALALPEPVALPVPDPHREHWELLAQPVYEVEETIIQEQPPVVESDLSVESMEAAVQDVMAGFSKTPEPLPPPRVHRERTVEEFLELRIQDTLVIDPIVHIGEERNWREFAPTFCRYPSVGLYEGRFLMAAIHYYDPKRGMRAIQTNGFIRINGGGPINQSGMGKLMHIEARMDPFPSCFINYVSFQEGVSGKTWCHVDGEGDKPGSHQWFIVLKRGETPPGIVFEILDSNKHFELRRVPEATFNVFNNRLIAAQANRFRP